MKGIFATALAACWATLAHGAKYDYIVVGAGTSGSVIASRLSQDPAVTVLLLEEGNAGNGDDFVFAPGYPMHYLPRGEPYLMEDPELADNFFGERAAGMLGRRPRIFRGKGAGGSSRLSSVFALPNLGEFDAWGIPGWGSADVFPFYQNLLVSYGASSSPSTLADEFVAAAANIGFPAADFTSGGNTMAAGVLAHTQLSASPEPFKLSSYMAYVEQVLASRPNLVVRFNAKVTRVTVDKYSTPMVATGVEYMVANDRFTDSCNREIILSAGAIGTPLILEKSGFGSAATLSERKIPLIAELPGVGENLASKPYFNIWHLTSTPTPEMNISDIAGSVGYFQHDAMFCSTGDGSPGLPDFCAVQSTALKYFEAPEGTLQTSCMVVNPLSRGSVHLNTVGASDPIVQTNAYSDPSDIAAAIGCLSTVRAMAGTPPLSSAILTEVLPSSSFSTVELMSYFLLSQSKLASDFSGTAAIGSVVGADLLVLGTANLRVGDLSVLPAPVRTFSSATAYMIGERTASLAQAAAYTVNIDSSRGYSISTAPHGFTLITTAQGGNSNVCSETLSRNVQLANDLSSCEASESADVLSSLGAAAAWIAPYQGSCQLLFPDGSVSPADCSEQHPVLCKK